MHILSGEHWGFEQTKKQYHASYRSFLGVVANALYCDIAMSEFELQSYHYFDG